MEKPVGAVILFGPPGAGKGTQAREIGKRFQVPHISTGEMLRGQIASGTAIGSQAQEIMRRGELVPDDVVNELVHARLQEPDCQRGFILDGYPRTCVQAGVLQTWLGGQDGGPLGDRTRFVVCNLVVEYNEIIRRTEGRRVCPACGTNYNINLQPPQREGLCDLDGAALKTRSDDDSGAVRERLQEYERQTRPVLEYFRTHGWPVHDINAVQAPGRVLEQLLEVVEKG